MQNIQHTTTTPQPLPLTPADKLNEAALIIRNAMRATGDEALDVLFWTDRDAICRDLSNALRLIREAREATSPASGIASCLACGEEELGDVLASSGCRACAYNEAISRDDFIICAECNGSEFSDQAIKGHCRTCAFHIASANAA